jgi:putative membrane protein
MQKYISYLLLSLVVAQFSYTQFSYAQEPNTPAPAGDTKSSLGIKGKITKMMLTNESFVEKAAMANQAEIELSGTAMNKTQDPQIKRFAQQMVADHTAASKELMQIAQSKGIDAPKELDRSHKSTLDKLAKLDGAAFDRAYSEQMKDDHDRTVTLFAAAAEDNSLDTELRQFANKILPKLRGHQHEAHSLADREPTASAR